MECTFTRSLVILACIGQASCENPDSPRIADYYFHLPGADFPADESLYQFATFRRKNQVDDCLLFSRIYRWSNYEFVRLTDGQWEIVFWSMTMDTFSGDTLLSDYDLKAVFTLALDVGPSNRLFPPCQFRLDPITPSELDSAYDVVLPNLEESAAGTCETDIHQQVFWPGTRLPERYATLQRIHTEGDLPWCDGN